MRLTELCRGQYASANRRVNRGIASCEVANTIMVASTGSGNPGADGLGGAWGMGYLRST